MKITNLALLMAGLSFNALAIEGGTSVNWNDYDDMVKLYSTDNAQTCSGTVIAGKFILTAAHCLTPENPMTQVKPATGHSLDIVAQNTHPDFNLLNKNWHDVAVSELNQPINAKNVHFFADLTKDTVKEDDALRVFGFGATGEQLNYAKLTMIDTGKNPQDRLDGKVITNGAGDITGGHTIGGDSGGAWLDKNNTIVATHSGGSWMGDANGNSTRETYSTNLHYSKDFILEKVNGWHYPTLAYETSDGKVTIKVQSLHNSVVDGPVNQAPYTSGDLPAEIGGTCLGMNDIKPFQTCTYIIESQGGIGTLHLSDSESIAINKPIPTPESGGGDSGGSLGFFSLIALFGLGFVRNSKKNA
ncbi:S1 family peptidase [Aliivibrio fischeri]|uniref:Trypsin protease n=1 Tax=Aliivibrio fischeri TaxID=668 RepID=A0A510ULH2_ALIFS|nr:trypsin-like serine protease [Aliivibrio fischeri]GEK15409.1 trypsin protease precursor [Aliivibrio fischeri]